MGIKLRNGKELKDALNEIAVYKDKSKTLQGKYGYYEKSEYYERLSQVLGVDGYSANYDFCGLEVLPNNQLMVTVKCVINILGEDGSAVHTVAGIGTEEIEYSDKNQKYIMLNNVGSSADASAFKEACRQLNIFNCVFEKKSNNSDNNGTNAGYKKTNVETKIFIPSGKLVESGKGRNDGRSIYKQKGKLDGVETEIIFYYNNYSKDDSWERYFAALGSFSQIIVNCEKAQNGTGYIFRSFAKKEA